MNQSSVRLVLANRSSVGLSYLLCPFFLLLSICSHCRSHLGLILKILFVPGRTVFPFAFLPPLTSFSFLSFFRSFLLLLSSFFFVVSPCWTLSIFLWLSFRSETSGISCAFWFSHLFSQVHSRFSFLSFVCSFHHFHDFIFHTWNSSDDSWIPFPSLSCLGLKTVSYVCSFNSIPQFFDFCFLCVFCAPRIFFLLVPPHLCISQLFLSSLVSAVAKIPKFSGSFSCW